MSAPEFVVAVSSSMRAALLVAVVLVVASVFGDVVHAALHRFAHTRWRLLRALASLHGAHHAFFDESLRVHPVRFAATVARHLIPEALVRAVLCGLVGAALGVVVDVDPSVVVVAVVVVVVDVATVIARRGRDAWHTRAPPLPAPRGDVVVDGAYHALHHAFPDHFLAAHVQVLDRVLGTMLPLARRRVLLTGASRFVASLQQELQRARADVVRVDVDALVDEAAAVAAFAGVDVVVLGHGADVRGPRSYEALVAAAARAQGDRPLPLDVWAIGDDAAWRARAPLLEHDRVILRRLVRAPMLGARVTLALLRRGARSL
jgi:hypothetical protein